MEKIDLNLNIITEINSFGNTGVYLTHSDGNVELNEEMDIDDLNNIIESLNDNNISYELTYPNECNVDMPEDEWTIKIIK